MRKLARTLFELQPILRLGEYARFSQILPTCGRTQDMAITIDNGSRNVTQAQVNGAARRTYADYPEIRKSFKHWGSDDGLRRDHSSPEPRLAVAG
jgi:hypothetical protein